MGRRRVIKIDLSMGEFNLFDYSGCNIQSYCGVNPVTPLAKS